MFKKVYVADIFFTALRAYISTVEMYTINMACQAGFTFISVFTPPTFIYKRIHFNV